MRKVKGFTLIELLVVISVIVLLMAILLPTLQKVKKQAKAVACRSNLRQWATIFKMYTDDWDTDLPKQVFCGLATPEIWMYTMRNYSAGTEGIRCCPMATRLANPTGQVGLAAVGRTGGAEITGGTFSAWGKLRVPLQSGVTPDYYYGSYGINNWLAVPPGPDEARLIVGGPSLNISPNFWRTRNVKEAGNIPMYADSWWWCAWVKDTDRPPEYEGQKTEFPCGCRNSIHRFCINRHDGFVNAAFLDYSVRKVGLKELWRLKWHRNFNTNYPPPVWPGWMRSFKDY